MRDHHPYDLGTALYRLCSGGRSPNTEPTSFADALGYFVRLASGNVSAAARLMGVPRRSVRDWLSGKSTPGAERRRAIAESAKLSSRRQRMTPRRETRLRNANPASVKIVGRYNYDVLDGIDDARTVDIGRYLDSDALVAVANAYLSGAGPEDLRQVFADRILDPSGFYDSTMRRPPTDDHGWTVERVTLR